MPATWPGFAGTATLEAAFGDTYQTANGSKTWTDISKYLRAFDTGVGSSHLLNRVEAGTAVFVLDNRDRRFEPEYTSGAYSPDIKIGVPIRFRATYNAVDYDVWFGFAEAWPQSYPSSGYNAVTRLVCVDGFKWLAKHSIDAYDDAVLASNPKHYWRLNDTTGSEEADDFGSLAIPGIYTNAPTLRQSGPGEGQAFAVDFDGTNDHVNVAMTPLDVTSGLTLEAWINADTTTAAGVVSLVRSDGGQVATLQHGSSLEFAMYLQHGGAGTGSFTTHTISTGTWHHAALVVQPNGTISGYLDGVSQGTSAVADLVAVQEAFVGAVVGSKTPSGGPFNGRITRATIYAKALTAEEILTHYENKYFTRATAETADTRIDALLTTPVGWPSADRSLDTGTLALTASEAQGPVLEVCRGIAADEYGVFYQDPAGLMTFKNRADRPTNHATAQATFGPSNLPYTDLVIGYDDQQLINRVNVTGTGGINVTFRDSTSEDEHGIEYSHESRHLNTVDANAHAALRVYQHKDIRRRVETVTIHPEKDVTNLYPQVLGRGLADRVTIKWEPPGGGTEISFDAMIEGISHSGTVDGTWVTRWELSPAEVWDFWKIGTGKLGDSSGSDNARLM